MSVCSYEQLLKEKVKKMQGVIELAEGKEPSL
jgi:hypothetical protein